MLKPGPSVICRYGGDQQPLLRDFLDCVAAVDLPDTAWAVLSCPVAHLDLDPAFLTLLDRDGDGRIRSDDVHDAVRWTAGMLRRHDPVTEGRELLSIDDLGDGVAEHRDSARLLAEALGRREGLSLADLRNTDALSRCGDRNGDGIVPVVCLDDEHRSLGETVVAVVGGEIDRNGRPGISRAAIDRFRAERERWRRWREARARQPDWPEAQWPLAAVALALARPMAAWFALSRIATVDEQQARSLARPDSSAARAEDPDSLEAVLDRAPLAEPQANGRLALANLRPGRRTEQLLALLDARLPQQQGIDETGWNRLLDEARRLQAWLDEGGALAARQVPVEDLQVATEERLEVLAVLCDLDAGHQQHFARLRDCERLLLMQQHLFRFCRNFIALTDLFDPQRRAVFEQGTLEMAGRAFHFAMQVDDPKEHQAGAASSGIHVLYIDVTIAAQDGIPASSKRMAVPVTRLSRQGLAPGRRGLFIDREGRYREARVVEVVDNAVSMREALLAPFSRIGRFITGRLEAWSGSLEGDFDKRVGEMSAAPSAPAPAPAAPVAAPRGHTGSLLLGGGVAFAALGSAFAYVTRQVTEIGGPRILLALIVLCVLIMVPTSILAAMRLYRRNLAGLISASGWALNDHMRLTLTLGRLFTRRPPLPEKVRSAIHDRARDHLDKLDPRGEWQHRLGVVAWCTALGSIVLLLFLQVFAGGPATAIDVLVVVVASLHAVVLGVLLLLGGRDRGNLLWPVLLTVPVLLLVLTHFLAEP